jgi:hypothetical protein
MDAMPTRQIQQQPDLLSWAAMNTDRLKIAPEEQTAIVGLLKQLLAECINGVTVGRVVDE